MDIFNTLALNTGKTLKKTFSSVALPVALFCSLGISGCSVFGVYKIDVPQGAPITQEQARKLEVGMSQNQVLYILGSPTFRDTIEANRWDYIYDYEAGTYGKREGKLNIHDAKQHLKVFFAGGKVTRLEGVLSLPPR